MTMPDVQSVIANHSYRPVDPRLGHHPGPTHRSPDGHRSDLPSDSFEPTVMMPAQYYTLVARRNCASGETRLLCAVLEDAVRSYLRNLRASGPEEAAEFNEVWAWFNSSDDVSSPFTFRRICEALKIDPDIFLARLRSLKRDSMPRRHSRCVGRRYVKVAGSVSHHRRRPLGSA